MGRGSDVAQNSANTSSANANTYTGNASNVFSNLAPALESEMANPQGFSPADRAAMDTEAMQGAGGTQASAVGQGGLAATRTRNAGAFGKAIADASRGAGEQLAQSRLKTNLADANLKQQQRSQAESGLGNILNLETGASNDALKNVAPLVNADTAAENASWDAFNNITGFLTNAAKSAAAFK